LQRSRQGDDDPRVAFVEAQGILVDLRDLGLGECLD